MSRRAAATHTLSPMHDATQRRSVGNLISAARDSTQQQQQTAGSAGGGARSPQQLRSLSPASPSQPRRIANAKAAAGILRPLEHAPGPTSPLSPSLSLSHSHSQSQLQATDREPPRLAALPEPALLALPTPAARPTGGGLLPLSPSQPSSRRTTAAGAALLSALHPSTAASSASAIAKSVPTSASTSPQTKSHHPMLLQPMVATPTHSPARSRRHSEERKPTALPLAALTPVSRSMAASPSLPVLAVIPSNVPYSLAPSPPLSSSPSAAASADLPLNAQISAAIDSAIASIAFDDDEDDSAAALTDPSSAATPSGPPTHAEATKQQAAAAVAEDTRARQRQEEAAQTLKSAELAASAERLRIDRQRSDRAEQARVVLAANRRSLTIEDETPRDVIASH